MPNPKEMCVMKGCLNKIKQGYFACADHLEPSTSNKGQSRYALAAFCPNPNCKGDCNYQSHYAPTKQSEVTPDIEFLAKEASKYNLDGEVVKNGEFKSSSEDKKVKRCSTCKVTRDLDDFTKNIYNKDGHTWDCRDCHSASTRRWRAKNRESVLRSRKLSLEKGLKDGTLLAIRKLHSEIAKGKITRKPCVMCGNEKSQAHHWRGYDFPLDVMWLCARHHGQQHRYLNQIKKLAVADDIASRIKDNK